MVESQTTSANITAQRAELLTKRSEQIQQLIAVSANEENFVLKEVLSASDGAYDRNFCKDQEFAQGYETLKVIKNMTLGTVEGLNMYETIIAETKKENLKRKVLTRLNLKMGEFDRPLEEIITPEYVTSFYENECEKLDVQTIQRTQKVSLSLKQPINKVIRNVFLDITETFYIVSPCLVYIQVHAKTRDIPYHKFWSIDAVHKFDQIVQDQQIVTRYTLDSRFNCSEELNQEAREQMQNVYTQDTGNILTKMFEHMLAWVEKVDASCQENKEK